MNCVVFTVPSSNFRSQPWALSAVICCGLFIWLLPPLGWWTLWFPGRMNVWKKRFCIPKCVTRGLLFQLEAAELKGTRQRPRSTALNLCAGAEMVSPCWRGFPEEARLRWADVSSRLLSGDEACFRVDVSWALWSRRVSIVPYFPCGVGSADSPPLSETWGWGGVAATSSDAGLWR